MCKLVSHPDSKMSTSFLPPPKTRNLARATVLLSAQDEAGGTSPGQSVKSCSGRRQKRVDLRSQNSLRITNGPTTFTQSSELCFLSARQEAAVETKHRTVVGLDLGRHN